MRIESVVIATAKILGPLNRGRIGSPLSILYIVKIRLRWNF